MLVEQKRDFVEESVNISEVNVVVFSIFMIHATELFLEFMAGVKAIPGNQA